MNYNGTELVSYSNGQLTVGNAGDYTNYHYPDYWDTWHNHYYPIYYPSYHICEKSKVEQAFKIVGKLLENKIIEKELTVKEFMKLVNDIGELL